MLTDETWNKDASAQIILLYNKEKNISVTLYYHTRVHMNAHWNLQKHGLVDIDIRGLKYGHINFKPEHRGRIEPKLSPLGISQQLYHEWETAGWTHNVI